MLQGLRPPAAYLPNVDQAQRGGWWPLIIAGAGLLGLATFVLLLLTGVVEIELIRWGEGSPGD